MNPFLHDVDKKVEFVINSVDLGVDHKLLGKGCNVLHSQWDPSETWISEVFLYLVGATRVMSKERTVTDVEETAACVYRLDVNGAWVG